MRNRGIIILMLAVFALLVVFAAATGAVYVPFFQTVRIIIKNIGLISNAVFPEGQESIIFLVRLPRVIVAAFAGTALAVSGAVMQGMFRNPMADPGIIGVSSGAGLGAVVAINLGITSGDYFIKALGITIKGVYFLPLFASIGALSAAFVIYALASRRGKIPVLTLVLSGIAVSTFISAITNIILTLSYDYQVKEFLFWSVGGLNGRRWEHVQLVVFPVIICVFIIFLFARDLNILLMGEEEAHSVGLNPSKVRKILLLLASVTTAAAVCVSGSVSFVGLIVPHIMRLIVGPDHRILLPASAVGGAIFLVGCDLISRVVVIPYEIGVGIITSLLGAPYFLYLLLRSRKEVGLL